MKTEWKRGKANKKARVIAVQIISTVETVKLLN